MSVLAPWQVLAGLLLLAGAGGWGLFTIERCARPRGVPPSQRPMSAIVAAVALWLVAWAVLVLVLGRGVMALALGLALITALVVVNNTKEALLREPLVFDDYDYLLDTLRHPRLFLPFLGTRQALGWLVAVGGLVLAGGLLEPAWAHSPAGIAMAVGLLGLGVAGMVRHAAMTGDAAVTLPRSVIRRQGLLAFLVAGLKRPWMGKQVAQSRPANDPPSGWPSVIEGLTQRAAWPHLVAVQSESFLDVRRYIPGLNQAILTSFDTLAVQGVSGRLQVPAFGANTVRSEHGFLSGIEAAALGARRYNPYRYVRPGCLDQTFVRALQSAGYRTLCIHPYHGGFYGRHRVMPLLGFDAFLDERAFPAAAAAQTPSPYVSDAALGDRLIEVLMQSDVPLFVFVITMENHGPLHLESVSVGEAGEYTADGGALDLDDEVVAYLRHLRNADRMLGRLSAALKRTERGGSLCWYGDHPPILPGAWSRVGYPGRWTDYLIWSSRARGGAHGDQRAGSLYELGERFLRYA